MESAGFRLSGSITAGRDRAEGDIAPVASPNDPMAVVLPAPSREPAGPLRRDRGRSCHRGAATPRRAGARFPMHESDLESRGM